MPQKKKIDHEFMDWLVEHRTKNQYSSVKLSRLLHEQAKEIRKDENLQYDSQTLVGVVFSLWRAVFLANRSAEGKDTAMQAQAFLCDVIETNAIGFSNDRAAKNWTFNYYAANARNRLNEYCEDNEDFVIVSAALKRKNGLSAKKRWVALQEISEKAIIHFESRVKERA